MLFAGYIAAGFAIVASFLRPVWGGAVLLLLAAFTRELGDGLLTRRIAPFDVALAGIALTWAWRTWRANGLRGMLAPFGPFVPVLLFCAVAAVRAHQVFHPPAAFVGAAVYLELVVAAVVACWLAQQPGEEEEEAGPARLYRVLILAMTAVALLCAYEFAARTMKWPTLWPETFRIMGPFKNPNQTGSFFAMGIPLLLGALAAPRTVGIPGWALLAALCLQSGALLLSFSRTSLAATSGAVLLFYLLWAIAHFRTPGSERRLEWKPFAAVLLLAAVVVGLVAFSPKLQEIVTWKVQTALKALGGEGFTAQLLHTGFERWLEEPVWGVGLGNFPYLNTGQHETAGYEIHGSYLATLTESGLVGALLMAAFLLAMAGRSLWALWAGAGQLRPLMAGALAALGALMATGVWDTFLRKRHFWLLVGLLVSLVAALLAERVRRAALQQLPNGLTVRAVSSLEEALPVIREAGWESPNVYLRPDWLEPWYRHFGSRLRSSILLVFREGQLIGYAPFGYEWRWGCRIYRFLGHGVASYLEPAAVAGQERDVAEAVTSWFVAQPFSLSVLFHDVNRSLPGGAALADSLEGAGLTSRGYKLYDCPYLDLTPDLTSAIARHTTSKKRRWVLRKAQERLAALGEIEFLPGDSPDDAERLAAELPELRALHERRFSGVMNEVRKEEWWRFLRDLIPTMIGRGMQIATLRVSGRLVAFNLCFTTGTWCTLYIIAMDPAFRKLSPGHLINLRHFERAAAAGFERFDFSKGSSEYKEFWQDGVTVNESFVLWVRPGLVGSVLRLTQVASVGLRLWLRRRRITSWIRRLPQRLAPKKAPEPVVEPVAEFIAPVLPALRDLPSDVQDAAIKIMADEPGDWRVGIPRRGSRIFLLRAGGEPRTISWKGRRAR